MTARETEWQRRKRIDQERAVHVTNFGPACQICGTVPKTRGLQWDHDHRTGLHRGWLCHRCNRALPNWITAEWLLAAACYLDPDGLGAELLAYASKGKGWDGLAEHLETL